MKITKEIWDNMNEQEKRKYGRRNVIKGKIGEWYVRFVLVEEGYNVIKLKQGRDCLEEIEYFLYNHKDREKILGFIKDNQRGLPDFLCRKKGEIIFIEVKTNRSGLSDQQIQTFKECIKEFPLYIWDTYFIFELKDIEKNKFSEEFLIKRSVE